MPIQAKGCRANDLRAHEQHLTNRGTEDLAGSVNRMAQQDSSTRGWFCLAALCFSLAHCPCSGYGKSGRVE
jgi:hypothetical protein